MAIFKWSKARHRAKMAGFFAGDAGGVRVLAMLGFTLMLAYYLLKPVRDALVLTQSGASARSYATGAIAVILIALMPAYTRWLRERGARSVANATIICFAAALVLFASLSSIGQVNGVVFFIFLGTFSVLVVAQFWAAAAELCGGRLAAPAAGRIGAGCAAGACLGSIACGPLVHAGGIVAALACAAAAVTMAVPLLRLGARCAVRQGNDDAPGSKYLDEPDSQAPRYNRYLLLIALSVVCLNWINAMGDYLLARLITENSSAATWLDSPDRFFQQHVVFYAGFYTCINLLVVAAQSVMMTMSPPRLSKSFAVLLLPGLMMLGYGLIAVLPMLAIVCAYQVCENGANYSIQNSARTTLLSALPPALQYRARAAIDAFCWRLGDVLQAVTVFLSCGVAGLPFRGIVVINFFLAAILMVVSLQCARQYKAMGGLHSPGTQAPPSPGNDRRSGAMLSLHTGRTGQRDGKRGS